MIINQVILNNFGSYADETVFDTSCKDGRSIIVFGGKNGAGKTTLFTAIRLCLYGFKSMGYKTANSFYYRAISKLINNSAKITRPAKASVSINISLSNGRGTDKFEISRSWVLMDTVSEELFVSKNGVFLDKTELADFEKYVLSIIPPELFNLFFFDGERIAEFFLEEGGNNRIKEAFLTLCGYDVFEIMRRNFKRYKAGESSNTALLDEYLAAKDQAELGRATYQNAVLSLEKCCTDIENIESEIVMLEKSYSEKGGITQEEWDKKLATIKEEEKKRENWNSLIKKWANDIIPFLMIRGKLEDLKNQITSENESRKLEDFSEIINQPKIRDILGELYPKVIEIAYSYYPERKEPLLGLSIEQSAELLSEINFILEFDRSKIQKCKRAIKRSIRTTTRIRAELETSSISSVHDYMKNRADLFEKKSLLLADQVSLEKQVAESKESLLCTETMLANVQSRFEAELKKASIADISVKSIYMLDKLQKELFASQIKKVEKAFCEEISLLMRKTNFIEKMHIDDSFNVHIYRNESVDSESIIRLIESQGEEGAISQFGSLALDTLMTLTNSNNPTELFVNMRFNTTDQYILPVEIDKSSMSNGEKQIFIMALYHALIKLSRFKVPFIIDTPFARIDTEHRQNISRHFFSNLDGQVFILSTNEEIDSRHLEIMKDRIASTYLLENPDNRKTVVTQGQYFEV